MHDERALIFSNLLNGNSYEQVGRAYNKTEKEIEDVFSCIVQKIKSYCFERAYPFIPCDTMGDARNNRRILLYLLNRIKIDKKPRFGKVISYTDLKPNEMQDTLFRGAR